jgi:hypothetical protein
MLSVTISIPEALAVSLISKQEKLNEAIMVMNKSLQVWAQHYYIFLTIADNRV